MRACVRVYVWFHVSPSVLRLYASQVLRSSDGMHIMYDCLCVRVSMNFVRALSPSVLRSIRPAHPLAPSRCDANLYIALVSCGTVLYTNHRETHIQNIFYIFQDSLTHCKSISNIDVLQVNRQVSVRCVKFACHAFKLSVITSNM